MRQLEDAGGLPRLPPLRHVTSKGYTVSLDICDLRDGDWPSDNGGEVPFRERAEVK